MAECNCELRRYGVALWWSAIANCEAAHKSKWFRKEKTADLGCSRAKAMAAMPLTEQEKLMEAESVHVYSVAIATAVAAEAMVAAVEVVRLTAAAHSLGKPKEEIATIKIHTAFCGYLV
nr:protein IQ-DOMAIN 1-like [Ipomoea trifida]